MQPRCGEHRNLAQSNPAKRDELLNNLLAWITRTNALLPSQPNPAYDPAILTAARPGKKKNKEK